MIRPRGPGHAQLDRIWTKYTQQPGPYGLRDPSIDERRALFECAVERVAPSDSREERLHVAVAGARSVG